MTQAVALAQYGSTGVSQGFKNRIINGAMVIDQRNAGASVTPANGNYLVDRFVYYTTQSSKFTAQQNAGSVTTTAGFPKYLGFTSSSAFSVGTNDYFITGQPIEGLNVADLGWGTANAKTVTLSFQVYSSLTGTFGGAIQNSAQNRVYPFSYTISSANTWTSISITIAGDTSGTWLTTSGVGMYVFWSLGAGSNFSGTAGAWTGSGAYYSATGATSVVGTNGATFYITGVQLEVGSTATSFDYRPYTTELLLCQRYFVKYVGRGTGDYEGIANGVVGNNNQRVELISYAPVEMRTKATISFGGDVRVGDGNSYPSITSVVANYGGRKNLYYEVAVGSAMTTGRGAYSYTQIASTDFFSFSAEL
jgi:hypothetical protein